METDAPVGSPGASAPVHLRHIDGMRAVAALVVFVNHAYAHCWNPFRDQWATGPWSPLSYSLVAGHLSVTIFIVISGFCLTIPVIAEGGRLRGGPRRFFVRRARRILPPYYGALALCLALIATVIGKPTGTFWDAPTLVTRTSLISHLLLLQNLFGTGSINYVFWSIAVEWQLYFLFPVLVWSWRRYGGLVTVTTSLIVGYLARVVFDSTRLARAHPHYLGMFALGILAAHVARSPNEPYTTLRRVIPWGFISAAALAVTCMLAVLWGVSVSFARFHWLDLPVGAMAASALVLSSRSGATRLRSALTYEPLVVIGTFSYSLYLIHAPILQVFWQYILSPLNLAPSTMFVFLMTIGLPVILALAYAFFLVLEAPFLRRAPRPVPAPSTA